MIPMSRVRVPVGTSFIARWTDSPALNLSSSRLKPAAPQP
jgi:hypothetical protein